MSHLPSFDVLYCPDTSKKESVRPDTVGYRGLTEAVRSIYGGEWLLPRTDERETTHTIINFVMSRDAKISFAEPGYESAREINMGSREDLFLMGLARARTDAVMIGDSTIKVEAQYWGTAEHIFPDGKEIFAEQRRADGCREVPLQVILTESGEIPAGADVLSGAGEGDLEVLVVTGEFGEKQAREAVRQGGKAKVLVSGERLVDIDALYQVLRRDYGVSSIACEGGPYVYGSLLSYGAVDEHLTCISPLLIGQDTEHRRPGLVEGHAFMPREAPVARLGGVRRAGNFLFLNWRSEGSE